MKETEEIFWFEYVLYEQSEKRALIEFQSKLKEPYPWKFTENPALSVENIIVLVSEEVPKEKKKTKS